MAEERELVTLDWAIKKILRSKANFGVLEGFLSALLGYKVTIVEILESESNVKEEDEKYNRVDIKVKNTKDEFIVVEIQFNQEIDYLQRMLFTVSRVISEHIKKGSKYEKVVKVISVNIVHFDLGIGKDYIYHGKTCFYGVHNNDILKLNKKQQERFSKDLPEDLYPEYYLLKVNNFNDVAKTPIDQWIYFLKNSKIKEDFDAEGIQEAAEALEFCKLSQEEKLAFEKHMDNKVSIETMVDTAREEGRDLGKAEGLVEGEAIGVGKGISIGERNKQLEIAQNLLNKGYPPEEVAENTGLTLDQINSIQAE